MADKAGTNVNQIFEILDEWTICLDGLKKDKLNAKK